MFVIKKGIRTQRSLLEMTCLHNKHEPLLYEYNTRTPNKGFIPMKVMVSKIQHKLYHGMVRLRL